MKQTGAGDYGRVCFLQSPGYEQQALNKQFIRKYFLGRASKKNKNLKKRWKSMENIPLSQNQPPFYYSKLFEGKKRFPF